MPDLGHPLPPRDAVPIGEALRALPLDAPPRSAWPAIAAKVAPTRRPRRWRDLLPHSLATAAALALAFLLPVHAPGPDALPGAGDRVAGSDPALPALMAESARLERLIAAADADPLRPADAVLLGLALEDEIADIDADLAATGNDDPALDRLWRQRVDLLARYADLQLAQRSASASGTAFDTALVSLH